MRPMVMLMELISIPNPRPLSRSARTMEGYPLDSPARRSPAPLHKMPAAASLLNPAFSISLGQTSADSAENPPFANRGTAPAMASEIPSPLLQKLEVYTERKEDVMLSTKQTPKAASRSIYTGTTLPLMVIFVPSSYFFFPSAREKVSLIRNMMTMMDSTALIMMFLALSLSASLSR